MSLLKALIVDLKVHLSNLTLNVWEQILLNTTCDHDVFIDLLWNHISVADEIISRKLENLISILLLNRLL